MTIDLFTGQEADVHGNAMERRLDCMSLGDGVDAKQLDLAFQMGHGLGGIGLSPERGAGMGV